MCPRSRAETHRDTQHARHREHPQTERAGENRGLKSEARQRFFACTNPAPRGSSPRRSLPVSNSVGEWHQRLHKLNPKSPRTTTWHLSSLHNYRTGQQYHFRQERKGANQQANDVERGRLGHHSVHIYAAVTLPHRTQRRSCTDAAWLSRRWFIGDTHDVPPTCSWYSSIDLSATKNIVPPTPAEYPPRRVLVLSYYT